MELIEDYLRNMDAQTSAEIVIFTIPSFIGHGIKKDAQEIQDRDSLANYLFNEVSLDGSVNLSNQLEATLSKIILTYEAYPELKSDSTVTRLMDELAGTENRISVSRTAYNDGVRDYNLHIRTFPNNVFNGNEFLGAKAWGYKQYPQYEASAEVRNIVPQVNLNLTG